MGYVYLGPPATFNGESTYMVGFYDPDGEWNPESRHDTADQAAARVSWLNGGSRPGECW